MLRKSRGRAEGAALDQYDFQSLAYKYKNRKIEPLFVTLTLGNTPEL